MAHNKPMDRFQEMRAFVAVVDAGSFVRAAESLGLSKTAVSRLVSDLESRLGARLLHRTTRTLSLTPDGEIFHERCRRLLDDMAEAEAELSAHTGDVVGRLRINAPVTFGLLHLATVWPAFMALHPHVLLDITLSDRVVDLVDEGYDLAVRIAELPSSSLVSRPLTATRLMLCASPDYLRQHDPIAHPSDLARHRIIAYSWLSSGDQWWFQGPQGPVTVKVKPQMYSNSGDTCCAAALRHQGIVLQPSFLVAPHLASGALVELLPQYRSTQLGVYAVYPSRKHLPPKVRALIDCLVDAFRTPSWSD